MLEDRRVDEVAMQGSFMNISDLASKAVAIQKKELHLSLSLSRSRCIGAN